MDCFAGYKSPETLEYLLKRRSLVTKKGELSEPAPSKEEIETILTAAARVPDHGKLSPFYFLVFEGEQRQKAGNIIRAAFEKENPDIRDEKVQQEQMRFMRAPLVIGVIYRVRESKNPLWEQMLSVGAACQNLILAANALGYGAQWLSEWYAYNDDVRLGFGLDERDVVAGYIYIGTPNAVAEERDRPDLNEIVTYWKDGADINKGDIYARTKFDIPELGFELLT